MAIHNRHLTTEQLSAFLDDALPAQERVVCEAHLHTCQQCQQTLAELRQTVALLHALPQPVLPRSFILSAEMLSAKQSAEAAVTPALTPVPTPSVLPFPATHRRNKPGFIFTTLRFASGIAAVIGIVLLTASLFSALPHPMMGASTASNSTASGGNATGSIGPEATTPSNGTKTASNGDRGTAVANNQHATPVTPAIRPQVTPGPRIVGPPTPGTTSTTPPFTLPDVTTPVGQALLGLLLLVLGILGLLLLRWQRNRQARAPTYPHQD